MPARSIFWRFLNSGAPGPIIEALGTDQLISVTGIDPGTAIQINTGDGVWQNFTTLPGTVIPVDPVDPTSGILGLGLAGIADFAPAYPFLNILKQARPWEGRSATQFYALTSEQMRAGGHLDVNGHPIRIPAAANRLGSIVLCDLPAGDATLTGRYRVTWTGDGDLEVGYAQNVVYGSGFAEFDFTPNGSNLVEFILTRINASNPIKLQSCVKLEHLTAFANGAIFRPEWVNVVSDFYLFRFMDWQSTNNSLLSAWGDRPQVSHYTWAPGVPVEIMVALCNQLGTNGWFNFPHRATNEYITNFATYVRTNLDPSLTAHYEYSNEVWNWQFQQANYANEQALVLWPDYVNQDGWMQWYGGKVAEMAMLLDTVYSGSTRLYKKVITTQTGYNGLEYPILNAPRWVAMQAGRQAPKEYVDELAVTSYFGHSLSYTEGTPLVQSWRSQFGDAGAVTRMRDAMMSEIDGLVNSWNYLKPIADEAGLDMVMYEGGSHIVTDSSFINQGGPNYDATLMPFLIDFHYSTTMGELYTRAMTEFKEAGGLFFNIFVEIARPSSHGFWGGLRHAGDSNPRWDAVIAFNAGNNGAIPVQPYPTLPAGMLRPGEIPVAYGGSQPYLQITPDWFNGVLTQGNPELITWNDDDSVLLSAQYMNNDKRTATLNQSIWNSGKTQIIKPQRGMGRWQWIASSDKPDAVLAMFTYASEQNSDGIGNGSELDFEYIINQDSNRGAVGARGFLLSVHMPRMSNPGSRNSRSIFTPYTVAEWLIPALFEIDHNETRTQWLINGEVVGEITAASMPAGTRWTTTAVMEQFCSVERHAGWAGWSTYTTASMKVWGVLPPGAPVVTPPPPTSGSLSYTMTDDGFVATPA